MSLRIAVIGGGDGALAVAGAAALAGHRVRLWDHFLDRHPKLVATGEITLGGAIEGTAQIDRPRDDLAWTIEDADLIEVTGPASALASVVSVLMRLVSAGQSVLLHPGGTGGALEVAQLWDGELEQRGVALGATDTLAYATRLVEENIVHVHAVKKHLMVASSRPARLPGLLQLVSAVHPMAAAAASVMEVALANLNPVIHPPITLLNAGRIESGQSFSLYGEGVVPSAATLMKAIDRERLSLAAASKVDALPMEDWIDRAYGMREPSLVALFSRLDEQIYRGLAAPTRLASRHLTEDVPLGLEVFVELAAGLALDLPITESVVRTARVLISQLETLMTAMPDYGLGDYRPVADYDLSRAALVVVDMTNDFGHPRGAYPRHGLPCDALELVVPPVGQLIAAAKAARVPVILCSQVVYTTADGTAIASPGLIGARPWLLHEGLRRGTWGTSMLDGLPEPDVVVEKARASGFCATPLDLILRGLGVDTIIVVGGYTNQCVESTVRDGWALDYRMVLPPDGCAAFDPVLHEATLQSLTALAAQPAIAELLTRLGAPHA